MGGTTRHERPVEFNQVGKSQRYAIIRGVFLRLLATNAFEFSEYCTFVSVNHRCVTIEYSSHNCGNMRRIAVIQ
jgi:hypothetical protein